MRDLIIVGSGCAGNTAALYSARANLKPLVIAGHEPGGQLSITTLVENFPGFPEGIEGPVLVENIKKQAEHFGAEYLHGTVVEADFSARPFRLKIDSEWHEARTLIIATGASARWLNLPNEQKLIGHGVSSCATCDGFFYRGKKIMLERARKNPKIQFLTDTVVDDIYDAGRHVVTSVKLRNVKTDETSIRDVDGFFVAIGHIPNTKPFQGQIELDPDGYIISKGGARTNVTGVFHAGDVQDRTYRQAVTAAGAGCMAAIEAERFLEAGGH